jgi:hypothetical protein
MHQCKMLRLMSIDACAVQQDMIQNCTRVKTKTRVKCMEGMNFKAKLYMMQHKLVKMYHLCPKCPKYSHDFNLSI